MKILLSGSRGFVGAALFSSLQQNGHEVVRLVRNPASEGICWDPQTEKIDLEKLEGFDVVIHLAGENIASRRWSHKQKKQIFLSRCRDTWLLAHALVRLRTPPKILLTASACGYYGNRGRELLTEKSGPGEGFLADVCAKWEQAASCAAEKGMRVAHLRFGVILSAKGGLLAKMLPAFRLGLGAILGSGEQLISWIALDDTVRAIQHVISKELDGAVNVCSPQPVTQKEFADTLAHKLHRPCFIRLPAFLLRWIFGREMADELLLTSQNVYPEKLLQSGFEFRATLSEAFGSCCSSD